VRLRLASLLIVLVGTFGATGAASAAPHSTPRPYSDAYPCQQTAWISLYAAPEGFFHDEALGPVLWVYVDPTRSNLYCGYVQMELRYTLYGYGCLHFETAADLINSPWTEAAHFNIYHCTAGSYDDYSYSNAMTCNSGNHIVGVGYTQENTDTVDTPWYNC